MKRIAVVTSGGDAPGMNAAVRAVVRAGVAQGLAVYGIQHGYEGLIGGQFKRLGPRDVGGIIGHGGTFLGTTRCERMKTTPGQVAAVQQLQNHDIDALIVIGGNGSQAGSLALSQRGVRVIGVASTIDNDLVGSEPSIGATTAMDVALESIDRLRVTASAHRRAFLVEVMGRAGGHLALITGITGGAEAIVTPESDVSPESIAAQIHESYDRGKRHAIVVVAEGASYNAERMAAYFDQHAQRLGFDLRVTKLGHVQRGGAPGVFDRLLATRLGAAAVERLCACEHGALLGLVDGKITATPLASVVGVTKALDQALLELSRVLAA
ncbi:MAG TPA: ATP-dependent 6-phosphofructokinase [Steroidobacteraceae bacterium]